MVITHDQCSSRVVGGTAGLEAWRFLSEHASGSRAQRFDGHQTHLWGAPWCGFVFYTVCRSVLTMLESYSLSRLSCPASPGGLAGGGDELQRDRGPPAAKPAVHTLSLPGALPEQAALLLTFVEGQGNPQKNPGGEKETLCVCVWSVPWGAGNEGLMGGDRELQGGGLGLL